MKKLFSEKFKEDFQFLEQYGFVFDIDPYNEERLCYRNRFGEIILSFESYNDIGYKEKVYVQINGWKKEIDLIQEYKKYIHKSTFLKSISKMFKELFIYFINRGQDFYGIKVLPKDFDKQYETNSIDIFNTIYNPPLNMINNRIINRLIFSIIILLFIQLGLMIVIKCVNDYTFYMILRTILCVSMFIILLNSIIILKNKLWLISKIFMLLTPIILIILIYLFSKRIDYITYQILFILSIIYIIYISISKFINKKKNEDCIMNGLLSTSYPIIVMFIKSFELDRYTYGIEDISLVTLIISVVIAFIGVIIFLVLYKNKKKISNYIGGCCITFLCIFGLFIGLLYFAKQNINYALDTSTGIVEEYKIINKEKRRGTGKNSGTRYYLIIDINGSKEEVNVEKIIYDRYLEGEYIELSYHEGFLNDDYFEIIE